MSFQIDSWNLKAREHSIVDFPKHHPYEGRSYARFHTPLLPFGHQTGVWTSRTPGVSISVVQRIPSQPFRFLELPTELRLKIYECLTVRTKHDTFIKEYTYMTEMKRHKGQVSFTMITKGVPGISILATCKIISQEAWPILIPLLNNVTYQPARMLLDVRHAAETVASPASPLAAIIGYYAALRTRPLLSYTEFLDEAMLSFNPHPFAADADPINNGYYQEYPFHLYPWMFRDHAFRNSVKKAAHQLVAYNPPYAYPFGDKRELQIGLTNNDGLTASEMTAYTDRLHSALQKWFSNTRVVIFVRPVSHKSDSSLTRNFFSMDLWTLAGQAVNAKVIRGRRLNLQEWEDDWAEGEESLEQDRR